MSCMTILGISLLHRHTFMFDEFLYLDLLLLVFFTIINHSLQSAIFPLFNRIFFVLTFLWLSLPLIFQSFLYFLLCDDPGLFFLGIDLLYMGTCFILLFHIKLGIVSLFGMVYQQVLAKVRFLTLVALVRSIVSVTALMVAFVAKRCESSLAIVAWIRLLARMHPWMHLEISLLPKCFRTANNWTSVFHHKLILICWQFRFTLLKNRRTLSFLRVTFRSFFSLKLCLLLMIFIMFCCKPWKSFNSGRFSLIRAWCCYFIMWKSHWLECCCSVFYHL